MKTNISIKQLSKEEWKEFLLKQSFPLFVQAPEYIDFYKAMGEKGWIFGVIHDGHLVGGTLCVKVSAKRGSFLFLPYGPVFSKEFSTTNMFQDALQMFFAELKHLAKKEKLAFIRISPFEKKGSDLDRELIQLGAIESPLHILAEDTWLLDVSRDPETILKEMNKNHRNLIRRCEREGVEITKSVSDAALEDLQEMLDYTAQKHNFTRFSRRYIEKEFTAFEEDQNALVYRAYLPDGTLDSVAIIMRFGDMYCYRHSASLGLDKRLPTSYLLQWEVIQDAHRAGANWYNFWGIAPEDAKKSHPFYGITHFKKGFGGELRELIHAKDIPVSTRYIFTYIIETIRKYKRGFN